MVEKDMLEKSTTYRVDAGCIFIRCISHGITSDYAVIKLPGTRNIYAVHMLTENDEIRPIVLHWNCQLEDDQQAERTFYEFVGRLSGMTESWKKDILTTALSIEKTQGSSEKIAVDRIKEYTYNLYKLYVLNRKVFN